VNCINGSEIDDKLAALYKEIKKIKETAKV
jgi:hypothetical protein